VKVEVKLPKVLRDQLNTLADNVFNAGNAIMQLKIVTRATDAMVQQLNEQLQRARQDLVLEQQARTALAGNLADLWKHLDKLTGEVEDMTEQMNIPAPAPHWTDSPNSVTVRAAEGTFVANPDRIRTYGLTSSGPIFAPYSVTEPDVSDDDEPVKCDCF
jgi:urocanate hydratase